MAINASQTQFPFKLDLLLRRRLGWTLLLCLLAAALVPPTVMGLWGFRTAERRLQQEIRRHIQNAAELKHLSLQVLFDRQRTQASARNDDAPFNDLGVNVNRILGDSDEGQPGWRTYLLDADLTLITGNAGSPPLLKGITVDTAPARQWRQHREEAAAAEHPPAPKVYAGPSGEPVLGTAAEIRLDGAPYLLVVEMETSAAFAERTRLRTLWLAVTILAGAGALVISLALVNRIVVPVDHLSRSLTMAAGGFSGNDSPLAVGPELDALARAVSGIIGRLKSVTVECGSQTRFMDALTDLHRSFGDNHDPGDLCLNTLECLSGALDLVNSGLFTVQEGGGLACIGRYPGHPDDEPHAHDGRQDGPTARAIADKTITFLNKDAAGGLTSAVTRAEQANLMVVPLLARQRVIGVLKLEKTGGFNSHERRFAQAASAVVAAALNKALTHRRPDGTPVADPLKAREAALRAQSRAFSVAEEKLQLKQLELEAANAQMRKNAADLEAHMAILQLQKKDMQKQNAELEKTHRELEEKARQLEMSSRYKTEFMANMSHELRTPLNSILLLSRLLMENKENTLTPRQAEFAQTVHSAGEDLLNLINEILDLAKVESGKMEVELAPVPVHAVTKAMLVSFAPLAEQKGVAFNIHVDPDVPEQVTTDRKRLEQIVRNFLSNAFKFTSRGSVRLEVAVSRGLDIDADAKSDGSQANLAISVVDTGIGIPTAKHQMVFEAFQQVDGSTRRKYGGTGLGLSISRELARILGGKITLQSEDGRGSRFTLHLPIAPPPEYEPAIIRSDALGTAVVRTAAWPNSPPELESSGMEPVPDDRNRLAPGDRSVLIIDADASTTEPIKAAAYREGYKVLVAERFPTGLHFADYYRPSVIFVNLRLPGAVGWKMISRIKANPKNRHTPVFCMSTAADALRAAVSGAAGHVLLPFAADALDAAFRRVETFGSGEARQVLVMAPDPESAARIAETIDIPAICARTAATAGQAKAILKAETVHAVVLHPAMDARTQQEVIDGLHHNPMPVYHYSGTTPDTLSPADPVPLPMEVKPRPVGTPDQLLLALVSDLHLPLETLDRCSLQRLQAMDDHRNVLRGRNILLVDDDMRTVFAVSNALEDHGAVVYTGKTGKESLDKMDGFPDIDLVLMDVMVSEVDGYQAIRDIRTRDRYRTIPIVALTARAMQGDRAKCIQAGADDYLAKPVNLDKLTSMLRIWLEPQRAAAPKSIRAQPG